MSKTVGLYIHIPFCSSKCDYCAFTSFFANEDKQREYIKFLKNEIEQTNYDGKIATVYIGGGTPSFLYEGGITEIFESINNTFVLEANCEITIEGNPNSITAQKILEWKANGINRVSVGLQTTNDNLLKFVNRKHNYDDFLKTVEELNNADFNNISCDLMLGLPNQTLDDVKNDLYKILEIGDIIKHISVYGLKVEPNTPLEINNYLVDEDLSADMYDYVCDVLQNAGYYRYEVSNFSKKGYESRHNLNYWSRGNYFGFGLAAHSFINNVRYANPVSLIEYYQGKEETTILTIEDAKEEFIMLALRLCEGIDTQEYQRQFGESFFERYKKAIDKLQNNGLINITEERYISINPKYFGVMNSIIIEFFD